MPVASPPPAPMQAMHPAAAYAPPPQAAPPYPYPPPGYPPPPGYAPPGYPPYPTDPAAQQAAPPAAPMPEPAPEPIPEPEPEPAPEDDFMADMDDAMDDDPMAAFEEPDEDEDDGDEDEGGENLSQDDLDAMFGDDDDPDPVDSIVDSGTSGQDNTTSDLDELDDLDDPDPIPEVFTADEADGLDDDDDEYEDDDEDEDSSSLVKIIIAAVVGLVLLGGIGGGVYFFKDSIPGVDSIFEAIGLADDSLGAGLSINDVKSARESISGKDVLVVRGIVVNISEKTRQVPMLELKLSDLDGNVVQSAQSAPLKNELVAGDRIQFKIQLESPSDLARRLEVTFVERAAPGS